MCQAKAAGGKRCDYADQVANIRKKARYKHRNGYPSERERQAAAAVKKWKEENSDVVTAHLPEKFPFQVSGNKKPIPDSLLKMLNPSARTPVSGLEKEHRDALTVKMFNENENWVAGLKKDEENALNSYAMNGYEIVNPSLRRTGLGSVLRENPFYREQDLEKRVKTQSSHLDSALLKAEKTDEIRKVYRFYQVPDGVSNKEFAERFFTPGESYKDLGYMSTSADPEYLLAHIHRANKGKANARFVVMEILTKRGASLQPDKTARSGNVQSLEKEYLLPRNMKMRIAGVRKQQSFTFADDRKDLAGHFISGHFSDYAYERWGEFKKGHRRAFPLIQLVDEQLITETV